MNLERKPGYCAIGQESLIQCDLYACAAGMGLAGMGSCFFAGEWWNRECPKFKDEAEFIREHEEGEKCSES